MNLINVTRELGTEEECFAFLEKMRWPDGVRCAVCGCDRVQLGAHGPRLRFAFALPTFSQALADRGC
jgi:hypothetical protein